MASQSYDADTSFLTAKRQQTPARPGIRAAERSQGVGFAQESLREAMTDQLLCLYYSLFFHIRFLLSHSLSRPPVFKSLFILDVCLYLFLYLMYDSHPENVVFLLSTVLQIAISLSESLNSRI